MSDALDQLAINTIRTLSVDAVQQANSGHPGTPMALVPDGRFPIALEPAARSATGQFERFQRPRLSGCCRFRFR